MRKVICFALLLSLAACTGSRGRHGKPAPYDTAAVQRSRDSLAALRFIEASKENGIPTRYHLDKRIITVKVDTASMTGSVDKFAADMVRTARKNDVNALKCVVVDFNSGDTLYVYE